MASALSNRTSTILPDAPSSSIAKTDVMGSMRPARSPCSAGTLEGVTHQQSHAARLLFRLPPHLHENFARDGQLQPCWVRLQLDVFPAHARIDRDLRKPCLCLSLFPAQGAACVLTAYPQV